VFVVGTREHHDGHLAGDVAHGLHGVHAGAVGQAQVEHHHVHRVRAQGLHRSGHQGHVHDLEAVALRLVEQLADKLCVAGVVFHQQQTLGLWRLHLHAARPAGAAHPAAPRRSGNGSNMKGPQG
jgi:hypothetical protein